MHTKHLPKTYILPIIFLVLSCFATNAVIASGAFSPFSGGYGSEQFNKGKAIYSGRAGNKACTTCHKSFRRSDLRKLEQSAAEYVSNCELHTPCYKHLNTDQQLSLNAYFNRRYHLK